LLGLVAGRFALVVAPVLVWTIWGAGVARHWWGNGGEQVALGTAILVALGIVAVVVGVAANRLLVRTRL
jgi:hypothetical protein